MLAVVEAPSDAISTLAAALATTGITAFASITVALIARRGDKRTARSDSVPDVIHILEDRLNDVKDERDEWRALARDAIRQSEEATHEEFRRHDL